MPSRPSPSVAVVGAGISGAACARALADAGVAVRVLDRGRAAGGRMASRTLDGRPVDLGASYLVAREPEFAAVVDAWRARGLARPWTDRFHVADHAGLSELKIGPLRYGAQGGLRTLVVDLLAGLDVTSATEVQQVGPGPTVDGTAYDAVVLAMPDPQAERLLLAALLDERAAVAERVWEPVLSVAAGWSERRWDPDFDGCFVDGGGSEGSDVLGWVADDGRRRGDGAPVLVAHTTSPYADPRLVSPNGCVPEVLAELRTLLGMTAAPAWTYVQRWSFARPGAPRDRDFHLGDARVGLCGDGWGSPRVETAWLSGHRLGRALAAQLGEAPSTGA